MDVLLAQAIATDPEFCRLLVDKTEHKIQEGYVDLTFPRAAENIERVRLIADWAREHKLSQVEVVKAKVGAVIRIHVPKLDIQKGFEFVDEDELNVCFDTVKELTDFANMIETASKITLR